MRINSLKIYKYADYIPIASTVTNLITLVAKAIFLMFPALAVTHPSCYKEYVIYHQPVLRSLALLLLPVISNLVCAIYDIHQRNRLALEYQSLLTITTGAAEPLIAEAIELHSKRAETDLKGEREKDNSVELTWQPKYVSPEIATKKNVEKRV